MPVYTKLDAGQVFSGKPSGGVVMGYDAPSGMTPELDPDYIVCDWSRDVVAWFIYDASPLCVVGPTGCGKTSGIKWVASKLNYPVFEITGHNRLETPELVGHWALKGGDTVWVDGPLTKAMREGGLFLLNEIDMLDPSTAVGLNSVLDGSPLLLVEKDSEVVKPAPGFRFAATANTNGSGEGAEKYIGTLRQNAAFLNRFLRAEADYLPEDKERALLAKSASYLPDLVRSWMMRFVTASRNIASGKDIGDADLDKFNGANLSVSISTRQLMRWAYWTHRFEPLKKSGVNALAKALDFVAGNACDAVEKRTLHELLQRITGEE